MGDGHRSSDQKVEAFSAPLSLLREAEMRADKLEMSKSGYFRYCLARELGYSEPEARAIAKDIRLQQARAALASRENRYRAPANKPELETAAPGGASLSGISEDVVKAIDVAEEVDKREHARSSPKSGAGVPIAQKDQPSAGASSKSKARPPGSKARVRG